MQTCHAARACMHVQSITTVLLHLHARALARVYSDHKRQSRTVFFSRYSTNFGGVQQRDQEMASKQLQDKELTTRQAILKSAQTRSSLHVTNR